MKASTAATFLTMLLVATGVAAQDAATFSEPPNLTVLEKKWTKEVLHGGGNTNPLAPNEDYIRQTRADKAAIEARDRSLPNQPTESRMPIVSRQALRVPMSRMDTWLYRVTVQNTGSKTIKAIDWEYQFLDPATNQVMGNRRVVSGTKIGPGKTKVLQRRSTRQPTIVVKADQLDKKYPNQFDERVVIYRVYYTDGSKWERPN